MCADACRNSFGQLVRSMPLWLEHTVAFSDRAPELEDIIARQNYYQYWLCRGVRADASEEIFDLGLR